MQRRKNSAAESVVQPGLFTRRPRLSDPPATSRAARNGHISSGANGRQKTFVLETVKAHPNCTITELTQFAAADRPGIDRYLFSRRLPELEHAGLVIRRPERPCKLTGRLCAIWEISR
jgi:hypothetical protein